MNSENRTPLILGIVAGVLAVAVAVTMAIAFTRTSPEASPEPSTSSSSSAAPSPSTPSPSASVPATPTTLAMSGTGFTIDDADGEALYTYTWNADSAQAVTVLTAAFGAEPDQRVEPGNGSTYPDYTVYQWPGFSLFDMIPSSVGIARDAYSQPSYVMYSAGTVGNIEIASEFGLDIGMPVADVRALTPDAEQPRGNVGAIRFVFAADRSSFEGGTPVYSVFADSDGTVVTAILAFKYSGL